MVKIYKNCGSGGNGEIIVQSDQTDVLRFWHEFQLAFREGLQKQEGDEDHFSEGAFRSAWNIALTIAGYKAENVHEKILLTCGYSDPTECDLQSEATFWKSSKDIQQ